MAPAEANKSELFVQALPEDASTEELTSFFSDLAPVKHAVVVMQAGTELSKGFGFVSFANPEDAKIALAQSRKNKFRNEISLKVQYAKPRARAGEKEEREEKPAKEEVEKRRPRLIIRNMPWSVRDKSQLVKIFSKYGKVDDAYIPRGEKGLMKGFAFVTMKKKANALKAIEECANLKIDGRQVAVDWAIEKKNWEDTKKGGDAEEGSESLDEDGEEDAEDLDEASDEELDDEDEDEDDEEDDEEGVEEEEEEEEEESPKPKIRGASNDVSIFVKNIPYTATKDSLTEHFSQFGRVRYALPVMDKVLNQPKGTAFVAFGDEESRDECLKHAPAAGSSSLLIADDVDPRYVFEGRILSITKAVDRGTADKLTELSARKRDALLGKSPNVMDKRKLFLLNEGRITEGSKLASLISKAEMEIREKSFRERKQKLAKNPSMHVSLTRLAIRNLPRVLEEKSLKQLCRKAVVEFAKEVEAGQRQPLSKEELQRSTTQAVEKAKKSKHGVIRQAKIVKESKNDGDLGRSRGFGFVEFRDHRSALMGLRWLNAHKVTPEEVVAGLEKEEADQIEMDGKSRRLVVEFAIENATIMKKRQDKEARADVTSKRKRDDDEKRKKEDEAAEQERKKARFEKPDQNVQRIIAKKRRGKKGKN